MPWYGNKWSQGQQRGNGNGAWGATNWQKQWQGKAAQWDDDSGWWKCMAPMCVATCKKELGRGPWANPATAQACQACEACRPTATASVSQLMQLKAALAGNGGKRSYA